MHQKGLQEEGWRELNVGRRPPLWKLPLSLIFLDFSGGTCIELHLVPSSAFLSIYRIPGTEHLRCITANSSKSSPWLAIHNPIHIWPLDIYIC